MALTFNKATRDLSIRGTLTLNNGDQVSISDEDVVSYSINGTTGSDGLPLGTVESASYTLTLNNVGRRFNPQLMDNAEVHMLVGIKVDDEYSYEHFGVWYVNDSNAPEQSVAITLNGFDALATRFSAKFSDNAQFYPITIGTLVTIVCAAAGIPLARKDFLNAAVRIPAMPAWDEDTTLRDILGYCAVCASGFVRMTRDGRVDIVSYAESVVNEIGPDMYQTFTPTGGYAFDFNAIEAFMTQDADERTRFALDSAIKANATNTIQIDYNPLLTNEIIQTIVNELKGISLSAGEISWGGDPSVMPGDSFLVEDLNGNSHKIMATSQNISFGGGMNSVETCSLPSSNSQHSGAYSTSTNMYDSKGNLRATRISGLDKSVVAATVGHFESLTAETATIDRLLVAILEAMNLTANKLDAEVIKAGTISADKLESEIISADEIKTLSLEAITAKIESLTASDIATDRLAAGLAAFTVITAGTASFDQATVQHLVANAMNLTFGTAGEVFIENLRVVYGQMVQAAIGNLCIKASDGNYYSIDVNADGNVTATKTTVTDDEISAGETDSGRVILETNITAESLNTGNLLATYALINKIDAARIDVDELWAKDAFIAHLQTADISSNSSIVIMAGKIDEALQKALSAAESAAAAQTTATNAGATASAAVESIGRIPQHVEVADDGLYLKDQNMASILKINSASVTIGTLTGDGAGYSQLASNYVQFGKYQLRKSADGGLVFKLKG